MQVLKKLKKIDSNRTTEEDGEEDEESLEPGEIVRDAEGLIVTDSLLKTEVEEENLPQVPPNSEPVGEPGEIVRDTEGEIVGDSSHSSVHLSWVAVLLITITNHDCFVGVENGPRVEIKSMLFFPLRLPC